MKANTLRLNNKEKNETSKIIIPPFVTLEVSAEYIKIEPKKARPPKSRPIIPKEVTNVPKGYGIINKKKTPNSVIMRAQIIMKIPVNKENTKAAMGFSLVCPILIKHFYFININF